MNNNPFLEDRQNFKHTWKELRNFFFWTTKWQSTKSYTTIIHCIFQVQATTFHNPFHFRPLGLEHWNRHQLSASMSWFSLWFTNHMWHTSQGNFCLTHLHWLHKTFSLFFTRQNKICLTLARNTQLTHFLPQYYRFPGKHCFHLTIPRFSLPPAFLLLTTAQKWNWACNINGSILTVKNYSTEKPVS